MQISTLGWAKDRVPITRSNLAYAVAKQLNRYLESMAVGPHHRRIPRRSWLTTGSQGYVMNGCVDQQWKIGEGLMDLEHVHLVRLVSVSTGSFRPEIWIRTYCCTIYVDMQDVNAVSRPRVLG